MFLNLQSYFAIDISLSPAIIVLIRFCFFAADAHGRTSENGYTAYKRKVCRKKPKVDYTESLSKINRDEQDIQDNRFEILYILYIHVEIICMFSIAIRYYYSTPAKISF